MLNLRLGLPFHITRYLKPWRRRRIWTTILAALSLVTVLWLQVQWTSDDIFHISKGFYEASISRNASATNLHKLPPTVVRANLSHPVFSNFTVEELQLFEKAWDLQIPWKERTIAQLALINIVNRHLVVKEKVIYTMNNKQPEGRMRWTEQNCPNAPCRFTHNHNQHLDAVVFDNDYFYPEIVKKTKDQTWIFIRLENPLNPQPQGEIGNNIDWMVTYWTQSLLVTPYNNWAQSYPKLPGLGIVNFTKPSTRDFSEGKTKKVVWFASNCYAMNDRLEYARELGKYIQVDIYGGCGSLTCSRSKERQCFEKIRKEYKFYLSFENANCHDYITEKFWRALQYDAIPIVMGASVEEYRRQVPPNSFIHVDDFSSAQELAKTLHVLDTDPVLYNKFFQWREAPGQNLDLRMFCRVCAMLHAVDWLKADQRPKQAKSLMNEYFGPMACTSSWKKRRKYAEKTEHSAAYDDYDDSTLLPNEEPVTERPAIPQAFRPAHLRNRNMPIDD